MQVFGEKLAARALGSDRFVPVTKVSFAVEVMAFVL